MTSQVDQAAVFGPFLAMMGLTLVVWLYMYVRRIHFLHSQNIDSNALTPRHLEEISPAAVANPSDNLKNLFEMPVLFYALLLFLYTTTQVDTNYLIAAWTFVVFRVLHSALHCTINLVLVRFGLYALSSLALWYMVLRAAWQFSGGMHV